jgi:GNAT superfamily N-acetyltransferase
MITYRSDVTPPAQVIADLYKAAQLLRPVNDIPRIAAMYAGSNIILTAWDGDTLVGILRGWTDHVFDGYICDLAVLPAQQKAGIGKALMKKCYAMSPHIEWVLRASKIATDYYSHVGWEKIENGWKWPRQPYQ